MATRDGSGHRVYYEVHGNMGSSKVACYLHGGPGYMSAPHTPSFFDPETYKIVIFDQRGAGRSEPRGELRHNTTDAIVDDIEQLREEVAHTEQWQVVLGGSWGCALNLAYATRFPARVKALIVRGVFFAEPESFDWLYRGGLRHFFPDAWARYEAFIPAEERGDILDAYARRILGSDDAVALAAAREFLRVEDVASKVGLTAADVDEDLFDPAQAPTVLQLGRICCQYMVRKCFFPEPAAIATRDADATGATVDVDAHAAEETRAAVAASIASTATLLASARGGSASASASSEALALSTATDASFVGAAPVRTAASPAVAALGARCPSFQLSTSAVLGAVSTATYPLVPHLLRADVLGAIAHLPVFIVHGRHDGVCLPEAAWRLHRALPNSLLCLVPSAAHSDTEPRIAKAIVEATDACRDL